MAVLAFIAKLKKGLGLAIDFLHNLSIQMFLISYLYNGQSFNVKPFLSQDIKQNVLLGSYLDT